MNKDDILQAIEDMLDSSKIPMNEYMVVLVKLNGDSYLDICRKDMGEIPHMYLFSEIFNSYTKDWTMRICKDHLHIIVQ